MLAPATDKDGHPITQNTFDKIVDALREIVDQYESKPDGDLGHGLTNGTFLRGKEALNLLDGVE